MVMGVDNVEHLQNWLNEALARMEDARLAGDFEAFSIAELDVKNYREMLKKWAVDDAAV